MDGVIKDTFGQVVPEGGCCMALASGCGSHEWYLWLLDWGKGGVVVANRSASCVLGKTAADINHHSTN